MLICFLSGVLYLKSVFVSFSKLFPTKEKVKEKWLFTILIDNVGIKIFHSEFDNRKHTQMSIIILNEFLC